MRFYLFFIFVIIFSMVGQAQDQPADTVKSKKLLVIYEFGAYFDSGSECEQKIRAKYGYKTEWGTCIATRRMLKNNAKVERILKQRHGRDWEETFKEEVRKCEWNE